MTTIIVLFNLKSAEAKAEYEKWAQTTDVPTVKGLASIDDFQVFRNTAVLGSEAPPPYQYCEIIQVNNMEQFGQDIGTELMQRVAGEFQAFADNPVFMLSEQFA